MYQLYEAEEPKAHLQWRIETVRTLLHGTLGELVEAVAGEDGEIDSTHVNVLLNTYRTFATTDRLLELVQQRSATQRHRLFICLRYYLQLRNNTFFFRIGDHFRYFCITILQTCELCLFICMTCCCCCCCIQGFQQGLSSIKVIVIYLTVIS